MITQRQAQKLSYSVTVLHDNVFSPGQDEGQTIPADTPAEVAHVEIGEDTGVQDLLAIVLGVPGEQFKETTKAKATVDLQNSTPADVPVGTDFWFGVRKKQERGGVEITPHMDESDYSDVNVINREDFTPKRPGVRQNYLLTLNTYNPAVSHEISLSECTIKLPVQMAD